MDSNPPSPRRRRPIDSSDATNTTSPRSPKRQQPGELSIPAALNIYKPGKPKKPRQFVTNERRRQSAIDEEIRLKTETRLRRFRSAGSMELTEEVPPPSSRRASRRSVVSNDTEVNVAAANTSGEKLPRDEEDKDAGNEEVSGPPNTEGDDAERPATRGTKVRVAESGDGQPVKPSSETDNGNNANANPDAQPAQEDEPQVSLPALDPSVLSPEPAPTQQPRPPKDPKGNSKKQPGHYSLLHPPHHFKGRRKPEAFKPKPPVHPNTVRLEAACATLEEILQTRAKLDRHRSAKRQQNELRRTASRSKSGRSVNSVNSGTSTPTLDASLPRPVPSESVSPVAGGPGGDRRMSDPPAVSPSVAFGDSPSILRSTSSAMTREVALRRLCDLHNDPRTKIANPVAHAAKRERKLRERALSRGEDPDAAVEEEDPYAGGVTIDALPMFGDAEALAVLDAFIESTPNLEAVNLGRFEEKVTGRGGDLALRNIFSAISRNVNVLRVEGDLPPHAKEPFKRALQDNQNVRDFSMRRRNDQAREEAIAAMEAQIKLEKEQKKTKLFDLWRLRVAHIDQQKKSYRLLTEEENDAWAALMLDEQNSSADATTRADSRLAKWNATVAVLEEEMFGCRDSTAAEEARKRNSLLTAAYKDRRRVKRAERDEKKAIEALRHDTISSEYQGRVELRKEERAERNDLHTTIRDVLDPLLVQLRAEQRAQREAELAAWREAQAREKQLNRFIDEQAVVMEQEQENRKTIEAALQKSHDQMIRADFESTTGAKVRQQSREALEKKKAAFERADAALPRITLKVDRPFAPVYRMNPHARVMYLNEDVLFQVGFDDAHNFLNDTQIDRKKTVMGGTIIVRTSQCKLKSREGVALVVPNRPLANPRDLNMFAPLTEEECYEDPALPEEEVARRAKRPPNVPPEKRARRDRLTMSDDGIDLFWQDGDDPVEVPDLEATLRTPALLGSTNPGGTFADISFLDHSSIGQTTGLTVSAPIPQKSDTRKRKVGRIMLGEMPRGRASSAKTKVTKSVVVDRNSDAHYVSDEEDEQINERTKRPHRMAMVTRRRSSTLGPTQRSGRGVRSISPTSMRTRRRSASGTNSMMSLGAPGSSKKSFAKSFDTGLPPLDDGSVESISLTQPPPLAPSPKRTSDRNLGSSAEIQTVTSQSSMSSVNSSPPRSETVELAEEELLEIRIEPYTPLEAIGAMLSSLGYFNGDDLGHDDAQDPERGITLAVHMSLKFRSSCIECEDEASWYPIGVERQPMDVDTNITPPIARVATCQIRLSRPFVASPRIRTQLFLEEAAPIPIFTDFLLNCGSIAWNGVDEAAAKKLRDANFSMQGGSMELSVVNNDGGDVFKLSEGCRIEVTDRTSTTRELRVAGRLVALADGPFLTHSEYIKRRDDPEHGTRTHYAPVLIRFLNDVATNLRFFFNLLTSIEYGSLTVDPHPNLRSLDVLVKDKSGRQGCLRRHLKVVPVDDITTLDLNIEAGGMVHRVAHECRPEHRIYRLPRKHGLPFRNAMVEDVDSIEFKGGYLEVEIVKGAKDGDCVYLAGDPSSGFVIDNPTVYDPIAKQMAANRAKMMGPGSPEASDLDIDASPSPMRPSSRQGSMRRKGSFSLRDGGLSEMQSSMSPDAANISSGSPQAVHLSSGDGGNSMTGDPSKPPTLAWEASPSVEVTVVEGVGLNIPPERLSRREMVRARRTSQARDGTNNGLTSPHGSPQETTFVVPSNTKAPTAITSSDEQPAPLTITTTAPSPQRSDSTNASGGAGNEGEPISINVETPLADVAPLSNNSSTLGQITSGNSFLQVTSRGDSATSSPAIQSTTSTATFVPRSGSASDLQFASTFLRIEFGECNIDTLRKIVQQIAFAPLAVHPNTPKGYGKRTLEIRMVVGDPNIPKYRKFDPFIPIQGRGDVLVCEPLAQVSTQPRTYKEGSGALPLGHFTVCDETSSGYKPFNGGQVRVEIVEGANADDRVYIRSLDPSVNDAGMNFQEVDPDAVEPQSDSDDDSDFSSSASPDPSASLSATHRSVVISKNPSANSSYLVPESSAPVVQDKCPGPPRSLLRRVQKAIISKDKASGSYRTCELYTAERSFLGQLTSALTEVHFGFRMYDKRRRQAKKPASVRITKQSSLAKAKSTVVAEDGRERITLSARDRREHILSPQALAKIPTDCTPLRRKEIHNLLKLITYECRSSNPVDLHKVLRVTVTDGCETSSTEIIVEINIQPVDDATEIRRQTAGPIGFRNGFSGAFLPVFEHCTLFDADTELFNSGFFIATITGGDMEGDQLRILSLDEQRALRYSRANDKYAKIRGQPKKPIPKKKKNGEPEPEEEIPDFVFKYKAPEDFEFEFDAATGSVFAIDEPSEENPFAGRAKVATFAINVPKGKEKEPSINVQFHYPTMPDEDAIDVDAGNEDDNMVERVPLSMIEAMMKCIVFQTSAHPIKTRTGARTISARVSPGGGAEEGRLKLIVNVAPTLMSIPDATTSATVAAAANPGSVVIVPERVVVYRRRIGSVNPFGKFLVLADAMLKTGFVAIEMTEGFNPDEDVVKLGEVGTSRMFHMKGEKTLVTSKEHYCGTLTPIEEGGATRGFLLAFDGLSRIPGSGVQHLIRSFSYSSSSPTPTVGEKKVQVTFCDNTINEVSHVEGKIRVELDEDMVDAMWGPSNGSSVLIKTPDSFFNQPVNPFVDVVVHSSQDSNGEQRALTAPAFLEIEGSKGDMLKLESTSFVDVAPDGKITIGGEHIGTWSHATVAPATSQQSSAFLGAHDSVGGSLSLGPKASKKMSRLSSKMSSARSSRHSVNSDAMSEDSTTSGSYSPTKDGLRSAVKHRIRLQFTTCPYSSVSKLLRTITYDRSLQPGTSLPEKHRVSVTITGHQGVAIMRLTANIDVSEPLFEASTQYLSPIHECFPTMIVKFPPRSIRVKAIKIDDELTEFSPMLPPSMEGSVMSKSMRAIGSPRKGSKAPVPDKKRLQLVLGTRMGVMRKDDDVFCDRDKIGTVLLPMVGDPPDLLLSFDLTRKATTQAVQRLMRSISLAQGQPPYTPHQFRVEMVIGSDGTYQEFDVLPGSRR